MSRWILAATFALLTSLFQGCSGAGIPPVWIVAVDIGLEDIRSTMNQVQSLVMRAPLTPDQRRNAVRDLQVVSDSISLAETLVNGYAHTQDLPTKCRLNAAIHDIAMGLTGVVTLLTDVGVPIPLFIPQAIGSAASFADMFFPGCGDGGTPSTSLQVRMRFERHTR